MARVSRETRNVVWAWAGYVAGMALIVALARNEEHVPVWVWWLLGIPLVLGVLFFVVMILGFFAGPGAPSDTPVWRGWAKFGIGVGVCAAIFLSTGWVDDHFGESYGAVWFWSSVAVSVAVLAVRRRRD